MLRLLAFSALVAYVSAQSQSDASQCNAALMAVALNVEAASCLDTAGLAGILTSADTSNSLVPSLDKWLTGLCSAPACTSQTLEDAFRNITTGCAVEFSIKGIMRQEDVDTVVPLIQRFYPTVRKIACLKNGGDNCIVKTLEDVETAAGMPLSIDNIIAAYLGSESIVRNVTQGITSDIYCSDCFKGAYNIIAEDIPELINESTKASITAQCGANFTDGKDPAGISKSANSGTETSGPKADDAQASTSSSGSSDFPSDSDSGDETGAAVSVVLSQTIAMALTAAAVGAFSALL